MKFIELVIDGGGEYAEDGENYLQEVPAEKMVLNISTLKTISVSKSRVFDPQQGRLLEDGPLVPEIKLGPHETYLVLDKTYEELKRIVMTGSNLVKTGGA